MNLTAPQRPAPAPQTRCHAPRRTPNTSPTVD